MTLKLSSKKKWLTLADSAKCLSLLIDEEVTSTDLLQLAIQDELILSIDLKKSYSCVYGKKVPIQNANVWRFLLKDGALKPQGSKSLPEGEKRVILPSGTGKMVRSDGNCGLLFSAMLVEAGALSKADCAIAYDGDLLPDNSGVLEFNNEEIESISGLWDLSMMGSERRDIEDAFYHQIDGPVIDKVKGCGVILKHPLANRWATLYEQCSSEYENLFPSGLSPRLSLPETEQIVIRQNALQRFADSLNETEESIPADQLEALPDAFRILYETMGAGELPHMDTLIAAWRTFWKDRRPNDGRYYPINREVAKWIKSRMEKPSATMADHMASIIRPIWAPTGRQPNRNQ